MQSANRLANRFGRAFGLGNDQRIRAHRVFRNFVVKAVIPTVLDEEDERGTRLFDDAAGFVAVLLFPLAEMATDVRALREIAGVLLSSSPLIEPATRPIDRIVEAVRAKKTVRVFHELTWHEEHGIERGTRIEIEGESEAALTAARRMTMPPLACTEIAASTLLGPMLHDKAD